MKKFLLFVIGLVFLSTSAMAQSSAYGISFGYGEADPNIDIYRIGLKKDFWTKWFETDLGYASGYFELSYNHWEYGNQDINGVALSPVFVYYFGKESNLIKPYIEGGIGVTYIDEYLIADRNLSTHFQFEDRIGVGVRIGFFDVAARYMHYSNASIKGPNNGIDIWLLSTSIQF
ncbi:MAG: acyloxyacyl hydrolase [Desulfobacula sp.]|nr:acyloxyacyl hydrolase [Desulfobacula sp.]